MKFITERQTESTNSNKEVNGVKSTPLFSNKVKRITKLTAEISFAFLVSYFLFFGLFYLGYAMGQKDASRGNLIASNETSYTQPVDSTNVAFKLPKCTTL